MPPPGSESDVTVHRYGTADCRALPESIHGKGIAEIGTRGHRDLHQLPHGAPRPASRRHQVERQPVEPARNLRNVSQRHPGAVRPERPSPRVTRTDKRLPVCEDCHSAHRIRRADEDGFKLTIMDQCANATRTSRKTYFDTYHGKVSQLATRRRQVLRLPRRARHPAVANPASHLSRRTWSKPAGNATRAQPGGLRVTSLTQPTTIPPSIPGCSGRSGE